MQGGWPRWHSLRKNNKFFQAKRLKRVNIKNGAIQQHYKVVEIVDSELYFDKLLIMKWQVNCWLYGYLSFAIFVLN